MASVRRRGRRALHDPVLGQHRGRRPLGPDRRASRRHRDACHRVRADVGRPCRPGARRARRPARSAIAVAGVGLGFVVPATNLIVARLTPHRAAAALGALNLLLGHRRRHVADHRGAVQPGAGRARRAARSPRRCSCAMAARMAWARFPVHALRPTAGSRARRLVLAPADDLRLVHRALLGRSNRRSAGGSPSTRGGWHRFGSSTMRWETAASAFWGGLAGRPRPGRDRTWRRGSRTPRCSPASRSSAPSIATLLARRRVSPRSLSLPWPAASASRRRFR